jgi:acetyl-CoA acyltransferase
VRGRGSGVGLVRVDHNGLVGCQSAKRAAQQACEKPGLGPEDVQVVDLHDRFSAMELLIYEPLGLCREGKAGER